VRLDNKIKLVVACTSEFQALSFCMWETEQGGSTSNALDLCSGSSCFKSRPGHITVRDTSMVFLVHSRV
jgi:hypothetical protein